MSLARYHAKRNFTKTPEPSGRGRRAKRAARGLRFVIQKHAASRLHYDFRLELEGTLKSWAVPKGPSLDPGDKRLAVHVEDHPIEYGDFEGVIPEKQYGAGEVIVWDHGTWAPLEGDARRAYREGHLKFELEGEKMHGAWALVRMHGGRHGGDDKHENWLLIKERDGEARPGEGELLVREHPESVVSGREVEDLRGKGDVATWDSKESDPKKAYKPAPGKAAKKTAVKKAAAGKASTRKAATARVTSGKASSKRVSAKTSTRARQGAGDEARHVPEAASLEQLLSGAGRGATVPATFEPQLATLVETPPDNEGWVYEVKFDGYRLLARMARGRARLITRNGLDWSRKFPAIVEALEALGLQSGWLDGEICVMNDQGVSSFGLLQQWLSGEGEGAQHEPIFMLFDTPYLQGRDLRALPLTERKAILAAALAPADAQGVLRLSTHLDAQGGAAQTQACKLGLEGLIGKRPDGAYVNGRSRDWIKLKCRQRQEFVITGYTPPRGSRSGFGSLLLGVHEGRRLRYAGRVGTGFDQANLKSLLQRMQALHTDDSPFDAALPATARVRGTQWVKPALLAEVSFAEWTGDGLVRQASFEGLREDKPARNIPAERATGVERDTDAPATRKASAQKTGARKAVARKAAAKKTAVKKAAKKAMKGPMKISAAARLATSTSAPLMKKPAAKKAAAKRTATKKPAGANAGTDEATQEGDNGVAGVAISHPDRVVYPDDGITKLEVARFYERVAGRMLPYIQDRPLSIVRCPGGIKGQCFFQKHATDFDLPGVEAAMIQDSQGKSPYIVVRDAQGLVGLAQMGNLELHAWNATMRGIEKPDMLVIDFDPADDVPWHEVADAARAARTLFDALGLKSFVKTTGGKGLHVVVPFTPKDGWDEVKAFSHQVALRLVEAFPDRFIATATKARRKGRIFIDYLRNGRGATAAVPYTLRARAGATVAVPLSWNDVDHDWRKAPVTLRDIMQARGKQANPWKDYLSTRQSITAKAKRAVGMK